MPRDYSSTARALALPISPPQSPDISESPRHQSWSRRQSMSHASPDMYQSTTEQFLLRLGRLQRKGMRIWKDLSPLQKIGALLFGLGSFVLGIMFLIYNERIFAWLEPKAQAWYDMPGGWAILWLLTAITAFPPLVGYSTCVTIAGFVYGFPLG